MSLDAVCLKPSASICYHDKNVKPFSRIYNVVETHEMNDKFNKLPTNTEHNDPMV